jgi:polyisoprenoid-binding protein YceI
MTFTTRLAINCLLLLPASLAAQQLQLSLDPARTTIDWTLGATLHTVHGTFRLKSGAILFDPNTGNASGEIIVDAASGQSDNQSRDTKMHNDVLESKHYAEIILLPKHVAGKFDDKGASTLQVQGVFRIHGADHDMTLTMAVLANGSDVTAASDFNIPYQTWGMKNPSTLFLKVDNYVQIKITAAGKLTSTGISTSAPDGPPSAK